MTEKERELYIPTKILDADDFIQGFGKKELSITGLMCVVAILVGVTAYQCGISEAMAFMSACGVVMITVVTVRRDSCNENVFQKLRVISKNNRMQRRYLYQYRNIYEDIQENGEAIKRETVKRTNSK